MSAALGSVPALGVSRPALDLLSQFAKGPREVTLATAMELAEKPRSTVSRWLGELVDASLLLRLTRDAYAVPSRPTQALLLLEPSAYARSLILHHDVLARSKVPYAFACIPIRKAMPFSLERAAPVLNLRDKHVQEIPASAFPDAFRATFTKQEETTETLRFPTDSADLPDAIGRRFPTLDAKLALALFAASGDPRIVQAALAAAERLGLEPEGVAKRASGLVVEPTTRGPTYPNTVVLPRWLSESFGAASRLHTQRYLAHDAASPRDVAGEDE